MLKKTSTLVISICFTLLLSRIILSALFEEDKIIFEMNEFLPNEATSKYAGLGILRDIDRHLIGSMAYIKSAHPYLGYTYDSIENSKINWEGFFEKSEIPFCKNKDEFVIAVFGGSVAELFAIS